MLRSLRKSENNISSQPVSRERRQAMEKAVSAARNAGESKFGHSLINSHTQEDKNHKRQLEKLQAEFRRKQAHIEQQKKRFVRKLSQKPDPTILVERAPSPENLRKAQYDEEFDHYWSDIGTPGYRRNTHKTFRYPSTLPTIDAYILRTKRKVNLWEDAAQEVPRVTSVYVPHAPLTPQEESEIQRCYATHLRRPKTVEDYLTPQRSDEVSTALVPAKTTKKKRVKTPKSRVSLAPKPTEITDLTPEKAAEEDYENDENSSTTFITEIPQERYPKPASNPSEGIPTPRGSKTSEPKTSEPKTSSQQAARFRRKSTVAPKPAPVRYSPHKVYIVVEGEDKEPYKSISPPKKEPLTPNSESLVKSQSQNGQAEQTSLNVAPKTEVATKNSDSNNVKQDDDDDDVIYEVSAAQMSDSQMVRGPNRGEKLPGILEMVTEGY